jgi:hypothetical protein
LLASRFPHSFEKLAELFFLFFIIVRADGAEETLVRVNVQRATAREEEDTWKQRQIQSVVTKPGSAIVDGHARAPNN